MGETSVLSQCLKLVFVASCLWRSSTCLSLPAPPLDLEVVTTLSSTTSLLGEEFAEMQADVEHNASGLTEAVTKALDGEREVSSESQQIEDAEVDVKNVEAQSTTEASSPDIPSTTKASSPEMTSTTITSSPKIPSTTIASSSEIPTTTTTSPPKIPSSTITSSPTQVFSAPERKALIGHLVGSFGQATLVLTENQKLALQQENNLRNKGYGAFSSALDKQGATHEQPRQSLSLNSDAANQQFGFQHRFGSPQQQQLSSTDEQQFRILDQYNYQLFHQQQQQTPNTFPSTHPSHLLHQLSGEQQERFLNQFSQLPREQQLYAYNQFLNTDPQTQQFAIKQFLSLDQEVLSGSLQGEVDGVSGVQSQQVFQSGHLPHLQPGHQNSQQFSSNERDLITTTQQQEEVLKQSLFSALQRSINSQDGLAH